MARSLVRISKFYLGSICSSSNLVYLPICGKVFVGYNCSNSFFSHILHKKPLIFHLRYLCNSVTPKSLCWEGSSHNILLKNLENYIKNHQMDEACEAFTDFKKLHGLPDDNILTRFITELSYTCEPKSLQKACAIILNLPKKKSNLLHFDLLYNLSLSLARAQMPAHASNIFRIMIDKDNIPPTNLLGPFILHMVKKEIGAYLASNILIQICDHFQLSGSNRAKIKPDTTVFNLVLDSCTRYNYSFKALKIMELMSQIGVSGDAYTIIIIARIHEINCQRDELKKVKHCVDQVAGYLGQHYFQFYDCLMSLHFKFNDIDSVSKLITDMNSFSGLQKGPQKPFIIPLGSQNLKKSLKLQVLPHILPENSLFNLEKNEGLVLYKNKKLGFSNKTLAKLILGYKQKGRINELVKLLLQINMKDLNFNVINACIHVGWLETAHDIIDDITREGESPNADSYALLLTAYLKGNKHREAESLLKQIKKSGVIISDNLTIPRSNLITCLVKEVKEMKKDDINYSICEFNSSVYFFMKAEMIDDALKTYKTMQKMNVFPNIATYIYMVNGYSSLGMYREITILWGDIRRSCDDGNLTVEIDLYEVLILNFLKGGYFERVMEVIGCMRKNGMYLDKGLYKSEFLKLHKNLYKNLKPLNATTEAQSKRVQYVKAFRKWADIG